MLRLRKKLLNNVFSHFKLLDVYCGNRLEIRSKNISFIVLRCYSQKKGKGPNNSGTTPVSTLFVPVSVKPNPDDINVGAELAGNLDKGELLKILNKFYSRPEIKVLSMENGLDSYLQHQVYSSFRKYCLEAESLPADLHVVFSDLLQGAGHVHDIFPYFLRHARLMFPHLECMDDLKKISDLRNPAHWFAALEIEDIDEVNDETKLETLWQTFKSSIKETAIEVFPKKRTPKKPWFNDKCRELVVKRKEAKDRFLKCQSFEAKERYQEISRKVNSTLRSEKRIFINDKLTKAEQDSVANNSKDFHKAVRFFQKGFCPKVLGVKDKEGKIVGDVKTILKTWKDYFRELLNSENVSCENDQEEPESRNGQETVEPTPTFEEIENVVKKLKNGKAAGEDGIPVELIKYGGRPMIKLFIT